MRPKSILLFERLYIFIIACSIFASVWAYFNMSKIMPTLSMGMPSRAVSFIPIMVIITASISIAIKLVLLYFISYRGSNVARWILVIQFVLALIGIANVIFNRVVISQTWTLYLSLFNTILLAVCVWLLTRPDANAWFKGERREDLHDTFS